MSTDNTICNLEDFDIDRIECHDHIVKLVPKTNEHCYVLSVLEVKTIARHMGLIPMNPCKWTQDWEGTWASDCGVEWQFTDGGPESNDMKFCCRCGAVLESVPFVDGEGEG